MTRAFIYRLFQPSLRECLCVFCCQSSMGRKPCGPAADVRRGAWTAEEDRILQAYIKTHGEGRWRALPKKAGLKRCGKSCRLRWLNYLRPDIKRGNITLEEEDLIIRLHRLIGNRWALIAGRLPGRTDNEIKNYWNTYLRKKVECAREGGGLGESRERDFSPERQLGDFKSEIGHEFASDEAVCAPEEDSWWDLLVGLDAAWSPSWFDFVPSCEDESPCDAGFRSWTNRSTTAIDLEMELDAVADFLDCEGCGRS